MTLVHAFVRLLALLLVLDIGHAVADSSPAYAELLPAGQLVFVRECAKCHEVGSEARNKIGPQLNNLFGRRAGAVDDFIHYSYALRHADFIWDADHFRAFVKNPKSMISGIMQIYNGLADERDIDALI